MFVEVRDDGPGIPADRVDRVFERFYKADPSRGGGTGLGLSIAAAHARLLGGSIDVSSQLDRGTTFTLSIPRGDGSPPDPAPHN